jgi:hypothetical protein
MSFSFRDFRLFFKQENQKKQQHTTTHKSHQIPSISIPCACTVSSRPMGAGQLAPHAPPIRFTGAGIQFTGGGAGTAAWGGAPLGPHATVMGSGSVVIFMQF